MAKANSSRKIGAIIALVLVICAAVALGYLLGTKQGKTDTTPETTIAAEATVAPTAEVKAEATIAPTPVQTLEPGVNPAVGSKILFGTYPKSYGDEDGLPIQWLVIANDGEKALLLSSYVLDAQPFNTEFVNTTWENCTLRAWLNDDFYNRAFSEADKAYIVQTTVAAEANPDYDADPGNDTQDNVFILSVREAQKYFLTDAARSCFATEYAIAQCEFLTDNQSANLAQGFYWWLRTPGGGFGDCATMVLSDGSVNTGAYSVNSPSYGVRPAVWVRIS